MSAPADDFNLAGGDPRVKILKGQKSGIGLFLADGPARYPSPVSLKASGKRTRRAVLSLRRLAGIALLPTHILTHPLAGYTVFRG